MPSLSTGVGARTQGGRPPVVKAQSASTKPRISKGEGVVMIGVGVLFDLLPLLIIILPLFAVFSISVEQEACSWYNVVCHGENFIKDLAFGLAGAFIVSFMVMFFPAIYAGASAIVLVIGLLTFVTWFWLKGVSPLTFGLYFFGEVIPVLNLLPFFTLGVWRCVRASQKKDTTPSGQGLVRSG